MSGAAAAGRLPMKMISRSDIIRHFTMEEAIACMETAFKALSGGRGDAPHRAMADLNEGCLTFFFKPASIQGAGHSAVKLLTQKNGFSVPGVPTITGVVMLTDNATGEIIALLDGETLTALRTGAASGLATQCLAKEEARTMALFGCGAQGRTQVEAVSSVRGIEKIWLFDSNPDNAQGLIEAMQPQLSARMEVASDLSVLKEADIICTATQAATPLFDRADLKPGVHINAIGSFKPGMNELHPDVVRSARVYLDDGPACLEESGDFISRFATASERDAVVQGEIGDLLHHRIKGRQSPEEITVFKSVGHAIQDFVVAREIYLKSQQAGFGQAFNLFE